MKNIIFLFFSFFISNILISQTTSMDAWQTLLNKKELADYFSGMFETLGISIEETGEQFTVHHKGDRFELSNGIDRNKIDFFIPLKLENIKNMQAHGADDLISSNESFRIMRALFTPLTRETLKNPWMSNGFLMWFLDIENSIHIYLIGHDSLPAKSHTLSHKKRVWKVEEGLSGIPKRIFKLTPDDAILYQRQVFSAIKQNSISSWWKYGNWYKEWRKKVSTEN